MFPDAQKQFVGFRKYLGHEKCHHSWQSWHEGQVVALVVAVWGKHIQGDIQESVAISRLQEDTLSKGKRGP